jgi:hypothetical protein
MIGLLMGLEQNGALAANAAALAGDNVVTSFKDAFDKIVAFSPVVDDINPVITPVLDLSQVRLGAQDIDKMMAKASIGADVSIERARILADVSNSQNGSTEAPVQPVQQDIKFEQNIYAPEALSTNDIYRSTKSQIALAKEELKIA